MIRTVIDARRRRREGSARSAVFHALPGSGEGPQQVYERLEMQGLVWYYLQRVRNHLRSDTTYEVFRRRVIDGWDVE